MQLRSQPRGKSSEPDQTFRNFQAWKSGDRRKTKLVDRLISKIAEYLVGKNPLGREREQSSQRLVRTRRHSLMILTLDTFRSKSFRNKKPIETLKTVSHNGEREREEGENVKKERIKTLKRMAN